MSKKKFTKIFLFVVGSLFVLGLLSPDRESVEQSLSPEPTAVEKAEDACAGWLHDKKACRRQRAGEAQEKWCQPVSLSDPAYESKVAECRKAREQVRSFYRPAAASSPLPHSLSDPRWSWLTTPRPICDLVEHHVTNIATGAVTKLPPRCWSSTVPV